MTNVYATINGPAPFIQEAVRIEVVENVNGYLCFDKLSMNSLIFYYISIGCKIFKIIKQHPNGSKTVHYLRLAASAGLTWLNTNGNQVQFVPD
jgi:hypothetical protein